MRVWKVQVVNRFSTPILHLHNNNNKVKKYSTKKVALNNKYTLRGSSLPPL